MLPSVVSKIENGQRRVTADELVSLAVALNVSPVRLLLPPEQVDAVQLTEDVTVNWQAAWRWAVGEIPMLDATETEIRARDPRVRAFIEENRPFEDESSVREAARGLVAREPVPFAARIEADAAGRVRARLTWGDGAEEDVNDGG